MEKKSNAGADVCQEERGRASALESAGVGRTRRETSTTTTTDVVIVVNNNNNVA